MKKALLFWSLIVLPFCSLLAQRTITGTVSSDKGEALIGASVVVKGTTTGAVTDIDGKYSLNTPTNATTLVFSFTGFGTQEITIGTSNTIDITLTEGVGLSELVVVGYGTQQKRDITGTVGRVSGEDIAALPVQSFDQALQGRVAGVNVSLPNGVLNNQPVFRVRGISSINLSSFPLVVLDGVPTFTSDPAQNSAANNPLSNINPNDIESIEILKDASAAAIYGSRASAGVVLITTKKGKKGKTRVSYDNWASWSNPARLPELLNASQFMEIKNEARANSPTASNRTPVFFQDTVNGQVVDTKWSDHIYRTGFSHNHNLNFSGGTENTTYYLSLGYTDQNGMIIGNSFNRSSSRLNLDHKVGKRIKIGGIVGYSKNFNEAPNTGSLPGQAFNSGGLARIAFNLAPNVAPRNADGSYNINTANQTGQGKNLVGVQWQNPVALIELNKFTSEANQIQATVYGQVDLLKGLYFRTQYGIDNLAFEAQSYQSAIHGDGFSSNGLASNGLVRNNRWNFQNILNYDVNLGGKNTINALLGTEQQYTLSSGWGVTRTDQTDPFFSTIQGTYTVVNPANNFYSENFLLSYFGRVNYAYDRFFTATVNVRQDEYSAFAVGQKRGTFWGASAGIGISEFDFWKNSALGKYINFFKLRGSYGTVGNNQGLGDYASFGLYNSGLYGRTGTIALQQIARPDLTWETSKKTDIGVVFGLLNDRLTGEITYYLNDIDGLLLSAPQAPSKGIGGVNNGGVFNTGLLTNVGSMRNKGWEFSLGGTPFKNDKFKWTSNFNISFMSNEVTALFENTDIFSTTSGLEQTNVTRIGQSVGSLFVVPTVGVNPANGRRMFVNAKGRKVQYGHGDATAWTYVDDGSAAPAINIAVDGVAQGPSLPTWFGSWDNTFSAFGFDLGIQTQYSGGNLIYNGTKAGLRDMRVWNNHTDVLRRWQKAGDQTDIPKVVWSDNLSNGSGIQISENVEKGDFLRIRNITLGYTIPTKILEKAKISSLRVYANVNNGFLFTKYTGTDPEVSTNGNSNLTPGIDRNSAPMSRTFLIGMNLGF